MFINYFFGINMKKNNKGFSLIELSIVLIIMGLLIAGVTGGASLIKSAKLRSVVTEFTNYRTAFNTYYAQFGKVPGAGADSNIIDTTTGGLSALFDEGIIDKEPTGDKAVVSKFGNGAKWYLTNAVATEEANYIVADFNNLNVLILSGAEDFTTQVLTNAEAQSVDEKVDDGKSGTGLVRGVQKTGEGDAAMSSSYNEGTNSSAKEWGFVSKMDF